MLLVLLAACRRPPEAPEGLTDSLRFLLESFHEDDATIGAGLTGLVDWFDEDGAELEDRKADVESVGAFQLGPLQPEDVERLPVDGEPDPRDAPGVVSVGVMRCPLAEAQRLLVRADQDVVFEGPWEDYHREYATERGAFEDALLAELEPVEEPIGEADLGRQPASLLTTSNRVDSSKIGIHMQFDLELRFRHGTYEVQGEPVNALLVLGFFPHRAEAQSGGHVLEQSWSIEADVARPGKRTLRVFGAWSELDSPLLAADSPLVLVQGVNEAQETAERMSGICAGEIDLPSER